MFPHEFLFIICNSVPCADMTLQQLKEQKKPAQKQSIKKYEMDDLDSRRLDFLFSHKQVLNPYEKARQMLNEDLVGRRRRFEGQGEYITKRKAHGNAKIASQSRTTAKFKTVGNNRNSQLNYSVEN